MRLGLRISTILISCCVLLNQGCTPEQSANKKGYGSQDAPKVNNKDDEQPQVVVVAEPPAPVVVPADPRVPVPVPPGGGGSQGAIKPARTGNPDASGHGARCGNQRQEPRGRVSNCPFDIYGTVYTDLNSGSDLVGFRLSDGGAASFTKAITYSPIGCDIRAITALEFAPDGTLYAVGTSSCGNTVGFYRLDCQTAVATFIGNTGIEDLFNEDAPHISDLDFDSHGQLFAYVRAVGSDEADQLGTINIATGAYTTIGETTLDQIGNGLASLEFPDPDELFQAGTNLNELNTSTGVAFNAQSLTFPADIASDNPRVRAMDRDHLHEVVYVNLQHGSVFDPTASYLAILNPNDTVTYLNPSAPIAAPEDLRGITVNRTYEECDGTDFDLPIDTLCSSNCELLEDNCDDFVEIGEEVFPIDNDFDGFPNCADTDCLERSCNDLDGCTTGDTCTSVGEEGCVGAPVDCTDSNECTAHTCVAGEVFPFDDYRCDQDLDTTKPNFGDCTASTTDACLTGRCTEEAYCVFDSQCGATSPDCDTETNTCDCMDNTNCPAGTTCSAGTCVYAAPTCEGVAREFVTGAEGCDDNNECTVDTCDDISATEYDCDNGIIEAPVACTDVQGGTCIEGECVEITATLANAIASCSGDMSCEIEAVKSR